MDRSLISIWATRLRAIAAETLGPAELSDLAAAPESFRDDAGDARPVDPWLVRAVLGPRPSTPAPALTTADPDVLLWAAAATAAPVPPVLRPAPLGPLFDLPDDTPLEITTETELCGLHALWTLARLHRRADLRRRCLAAAVWHTGEIQPDNATNLPWAIHVFIVFAHEHRSPEALLDAEMRLHNTLAARARPDRRSALILLHAAAELDAA